MFFHLGSLRCERPGWDSRGELVGGGSAADPWFRQQLADATGRTVIAPVDGESDYSALGAAAVVAAGAGVSLPLLVGATTATEPDPERAAWWAALALRLDDARGRVGHGVAGR